MSEIPLSTDARVEQGPIRLDRDFLDLPQANMLPRWTVSALSDQRGLVTRVYPDFADVPGDAGMSREWSRVTSEAEAGLVRVMGEGYVSEVRKFSEFAQRVCVLTSDGANTMFTYRQAMAYWGFTRMHDDDYRRLLGGIRDLYDKRRMSVFWSPPRTESDSIEASRKLTAAAVADAGQFTQALGAGLDTRPEEINLSNLAAVFTNILTTEMQAMAFETETVHELLTQDIRIGSTIMTVLLARAMIERQQEGTIQDLDAMIRTYQALLWSEVVPDPATAESGRDAYEYEEFSNLLVLMRDYMFQIACPHAYALGSDLQKVMTSLSSDGGHQRALLRRPFMNDLPLIGEWYQHVWQESGSPYSVTNNRLPVVQSGNKGIFGLIAGALRNPEVQSEVNRLVKELGKLPWKGELEWLGQMPVKIRRGETYFNTAINWLMRFDNY